MDKRGAWFGLPRLASRPSGATQSPLDKCIHERSKCANHTTTTARRGAVLAVNLSMGMFFVSRRAHGQVMEESVIFDFLQKNVKSSAVKILQVDVRVQF